MWEKCYDTVIISDLHLGSEVSRAGDDRIRPWLMKRTVKQMRKLLAEGVDRRGYFHWSLTDNFEWNEGWHLRFGLIELDPLTQARRPRPSAQLFADHPQEPGMVGGPSDNSVNSREDP